VFELMGREAATYEIETSTNLSDWTRWITTNTSVSVSLLDPSGGTGSHRFYRALNH
jgi:hypothetical protein